jgi:uridine kinase
MNTENDKYQLFIDISGVAGSGKTTILHLIQDELKQRGFIVKSYEQLYDVEHESDEFIDKCLKSMADRGTEIVIRTNPIRRYL